MRLAFGERTVRDNRRAIRANHRQRMAQKRTHVVFVAVEHDHADVVALAADQLDHCFGAVHTPFFGDLRDRPAEVARALGRADFGHE